VNNKSILRIIDVNSNRTREGLRVCEDIVRFILNDASLSKKLKFLRHKVQKALNASKATLQLLHNSRDIRQDVGTAFSHLERKSDWQSIFFANLQRTKESLRVLEEFFKLFDNKTGERFKALRFEVYDFEKKITKKCKAISDTKRKQEPEAFIS
jgi:hypothetical protein